MDAQQKLLKKDLERGEIIRTLAVWGLTWMKMDMLRHELALNGHHLTNEEIGFHLLYLSGAELLNTRRRQDTGDWRPDRIGDAKPEEIEFVKLTNKGLNLYDGRIEPDPGVKF
jgi:hypothetical protein